MIKTDAVTQGHGDAESFFDKQLGGLDMISLTEVLAGILSSAISTCGYGVHTNPIRSHLVPLRPQTEVWTADASTGGTRATHCLGYTSKVHLRGLNPKATGARYEMVPLYILFRRDIISFSSSASSAPLWFVKKANSGFAS